MTADLKAAERGILIDLLMQIHQRGEPIINDPARLARACGTTKAAFERALTAFLEDGRIVISAGKLWSSYIEAELDNCEKRSQVAKEKASKRWEKSQRNQSDADAAACRYRDIEIVEGASTKPPSSTDNNNLHDTDAHLTGASPDPVVLLEIGQSIDHDQFGACEVVDISQPFTDMMAGRECEFKAIRLHSHNGLDLTFAARLSDGTEAPLWKTLKRYDELSPARLKQLGWKAGQPPQGAGQRTSKRRGGNAA